MDLDFRLNVYYTRGGEKNIHVFCSRNYSEVIPVELLALWPSVVATNRSRKGRRTMEQK